MLGVGKAVYGVVSIQTQNSSLTGLFDFQILFWTSTTYVSLPPPSSPSYITVRPSIPYRPGFEETLKDTN